MAEYQFFLTSSLEKVFPDQRPVVLKEGSSLSAWPGARASVQLVYRADDQKGFVPLQEFLLDITGAPCKTQLRTVELIPSDFPCYGMRDEFYITDRPGLFPDLLKPLEKETIRPITGQYRSIWISWDIPEGVKEGDYKIEIHAKAVEKRRLPNGVYYEEKEAKQLSFKNTMILRVGKKELPKQKLIHTEWFHADSLADYYKTEVFSETHWQIIENYIKAAGTRHAVNMLLTPVFTPPLDTPKGGERRTVQLVDVYCENGGYRFDFHKLKRWVNLCHKYGIEYLEIAHFFTQWGAVAAPKVVAVVDGVRKQIFGWDTDLSEKKYQSFLEALIPQLQKELFDLGYDQKKIFYHISDEPSIEHIRNYKRAREIIIGLVPGEQIIDALSSLEFYKTGLLVHPVPDTSKIDEFYKAKVSDLWVYYCCGQCVNVPNRFFAMESARNRIMGVLMYLYNIQGFLHWGYNFYYTQYAMKPVDPYGMTHADYAFPSGDAFLVYPGEAGEPLDSIRSEVQEEGLLDLRALRLLEELTDRSFVENMIYEDLPYRPMTFHHYPREANWILHLREKTAEEINKRQ